MKTTKLLFYFIILLCIDINISCAQDYHPDGVTVENGIYIKDLPQNGTFTLVLKDGKIDTSGNNSFSIISLPTWLPSERSILMYDTTPDSTNLTWIALEADVLNTTWTPDTGGVWMLLYNPLDSANNLQWVYLEEDTSSSGGSASGNIVLNDDILDFDSTNQKYTLYTSLPSGLGLYTGTTNPTGTTRLNVNGDLHTTEFNINSTSDYPMNVVSSGLGANFRSTSNVSLHCGDINSNGAGLLTYSRTGYALRAEAGGILSADENTSVVAINRLHSGAYNTSGDILDITDNPTVSGTISGAILRATIGATDRIVLNPRATAGNTSYFFDSDVDMTTGNILNVANQGSSVFSVQKGVATITDILHITPRSSAPGSPSLGDIYINSTDNHAYFYNGSSWVQLDN